MQTAASIDRINRQAWKSADSLRAYLTREGWTDAGEERAIGRVAPEMIDRPILDIGVGGGRTVPLLTAISENYTGVDYTPELLAICRTRFPGVEVRAMDARDLSAFADASFALVVFSFNGIDSVDLDDRVRILREIHRVLAPAGLLVFSTHNKRGPLCGQNLSSLRPAWTFNPVKLAWRVLRAVRTLPRALLNYMRHAHLEAHTPGWCIKRAAAHQFGIVIAYAELSGQTRQLTTLGFDTEAVYADTGRMVDEHASTADVAWFHFVARKTVSAAGTGGAPAEMQQNREACHHA